MSIQSSPCSVCPNVVYRFDGHANASSPNSNDYRRASAAAAGDAAFEDEQGLAAHAEPKISVRSRPLQ
jgi:hypothetical protein